MRYLSKRHGVGVVLGFIVCIGTAASLGPLTCSCYSFYGKSSEWEESRSLCQSGGGDLVSIETLREWEFIRNQTGGRVTDSGVNQWWIGLQSKEMHWVWLSDSPLKYNDNWAYLELSDRQVSSYSFAVIEKDTGNYWKAIKSMKSGKICEYKGQGCTINQTEWCGEDHSTTTSNPLQRTTTRTTAATTTSNKVITEIQKMKPTIFYQRSTANGNPTATTTRQYKGNKDRRSVHKQNKKFTIVQFMVVLAVILLLCVGILIVVWINKTRKRGKHKLTHRRHKPSSRMEDKFDVKNVYDQYSEYSSGHYDNISSPQKNCTNNTTYSNQYKTSRGTKDAEKQMKVSQVNDEFFSETMYEEMDDHEQRVTDAVEQKTPEVKPEENVDKLESTFALKTFGKSQENSDDDVFYTEIVPGSLPNEGSSNIFTYASICDSDDKKPAEVVYDEVDEVEKNEKDVTYAEISDFNANADVPLKKPTPYSRTEYASVTIHPLSPRKFDR